MTFPGKLLFTVLLLIPVLFLSCKKKKPSHPDEEPHGGQSIFNDHNSGNLPTEIYQTSYQELKN